MTLQRLPHQHPQRRPSINALLMACGLPKALAYQSSSWPLERLAKRPTPKSFYERWDGELPYLWFEARQAFRAKVKIVRPDLPGREEEGRQLLASWTRLKKLFRQHGVPV